MSDFISRGMAKDAQNKAEEARIAVSANPLEPVADFAAISTTYTSPKNGDEVQTLDDGKIYRYKDGEWKYVKYLDATPVQAMQNQINSANDEITNLKNKQTDIEGKLSEADRQTQVLQHGINLVKSDVATPVDFEIQGRTLVSMANSNLKPEGYYVIADEKIKVKDTDGQTHSGVGKFTRTRLSTKEDFSGKVSESTSANPHTSKTPVLVGATKLYTPEEFITESNTPNYDYMSSLNGMVSSVGREEDGAIGQRLFSFSIIEAVERKLGRIPATDKVQWLRDNINKLSANWWGFGSSPNGNKASLGYWKRDSNEWGTSSIWSKTSSKPELISILFLSTIPNVIDDEGKLHVIAYADPSDGTNPSVVYTDYISLDVELKPSAQLDTRPSIIRVENFEGKVSGSTVENPHNSKYKSSPVLIEPASNTWADWNEHDSFNMMSKLDGTIRTVTSSVQGVMAQQIFSFNIIESIERKIGKIPKVTISEKVSWAESNVSKIKATWWGYGSSPSGNRANFTMWTTISNLWATSTLRTHTSSSINKLEIEFSPRVDSNGFVHFIAYAEATDGVTPTTIRTDYIELEIELSHNADFHSPKVPLYEITKEEYDKIGIEWDNQTIKTRYPSVEGVQHLQNPYVMTEGENLIPPFYEWTMQSGITPVNESPYELTADFDITTKYMGTGEINVVKGQEYTFSYSGNKTVQYAIQEAETGAYITGYTLNGSLTFTPKTDKIKVYARAGSSGNALDNPYTFSNFMLTAGNTVKPFKPRNPSYLYAEIKLGSILGKKDALFKEDGRWKVRKQIEKDVVLDGSLGWMHSVNFDGFKGVYTTAHVPHVTNLIGTKYNGKNLHVYYSGGVSMMTTTDTIYGSGAATVISVSNSDSGWGNNYTPSSSEMRAYFNGWKVKTADANGKPTAWVSLVDGTDAPTQTLDYVSNNRAANYVPYKMSYILTTPIIENVKVEGDIVADGLTQIEVWSGVIVREKLTPQLVNGNLYYMNHIPYKNTLENKPDRFIAVYKGREIDNSWITNRHANYYGGIGLQSSNVDPEADYYVTYIVQEKQRFTTNPVDVKALFAKNIRSAHDDLTVKVSDLKTATSINVQAIAELYKRIKALGG